MTARGLSRKTCLTLATLAVAVSACRDTHGPHGGRGGPTGDPPDSLVALAPLIVSNPEEIAGNTPGSPSGSADQLIYASLPPGSISNGKAITVTNRTTGEQLSAVMVDGGFDPLPLTAEVGDTIDIRIETSDGSFQEFSSLVPAFRPPVIVRVDPPPAKRDVPLNTIVRLVFSEPIDPGTITGGSVQLRFNGALVGGSLAFEDPSNLVVTLTLPQSLLPATAYTVSVTRAVTDVTGDPLAAVFSSTVTTVALPPTPGPAGIYVGTLNGSGAVSTELWIAAGNRPAWSPDGQRIAFEALGEIRVINADGSNEVAITQGMEPAWSPDGSRLVFAVGGGISVVDLATKATTQLIAPDFDPRVPEAWGLAKPDWSPDGRFIAFEHYGDDNVPAQVYVMNADGGSPYRLSNTPGRMVAESDPAWSADGAWIVYWSYDLGIVFADPAGISPISVYLNFPFIAYGARPDFSPDGNTILFSDYHRDGLYAVSRSGVGFRPLVSNAYHGAWSPDGTRIAFVRGAP